MHACMQEHILKLSKSGVYAKKVRILKLQACMHIYICYSIPALWVDFIAKGLHSNNSKDVVNGYQ